MRKSNSGFTLIEMLVVLAIVAITLNMAAPSSNALIERNRSATHVNNFMTALSLARSEALKTGGVISVQAIDPSDDENEFGNGWCVVEGNPGNCNGILIKSFAGVSGDVTLDSIEDVASIQFNNVGELSNAPVQNIDLCTGGSSDRRIFIALVGRSKSYRASDAVVTKRPGCS
jgi:type IV fimbrial biogenesis protein FimT